MNYNLITPCDQCPFLEKNAHGYTMNRLREFISGAFPCHKTADEDEDGNFRARVNSCHCAGALIFLEKRNKPNQMMRISERLGFYDRTKLNMKAKVR
jgi:hypothetical protein